MWTIEYGADWADSYEVSGYDWDKSMEILSFYLAKMVDDRLITQEEFEQGMEWVTGVVIDDEDVRVPAYFSEEYGGGLSIAVTLVSDGKD